MAGNGWNVTPKREGVELIRYASSKGSIFWTAGCQIRNPEIIIGEGIKENREQWYIQGHIGATWKDEQYYRTRHATCAPTFEDLLKRLQTDYIDIGMIHYWIPEERGEQIQHSDYWTTSWN